MTNKETMINRIEKIEQTFRKSFIKTLEEIEEELDNMNPIWGHNDCLCVFCDSNGYDSKVGIVHQDDCLIIKLRKMIKNNELKIQLNQLEKELSAFGKAEPKPQQLEQKASPKITLERWEDDEFVICVDGKPRGGTVTEKRGEVMVRWLKVGGLLYGG